MKNNHKKDLSKIIKKAPSLMVLIKRVEFCGIFYKINDLLNILTTLRYKGVYNISRYDFELNNMSENKYFKITESDSGSLTLRPSKKLTKIIDNLIDWLYEEADKE